MATKSKIATVLKKSQTSECEQLAAAEAARIQGIKDDIAQWYIETKEDYLDAGTKLKEVAAAKRFIEAKEAGILEPLKTAMRRTRDLFRPWIDICRLARALLEDKRRDYRNVQDQERREEEARLRELAEKERIKIAKRVEKRAEKAIERGDVDKVAEIMADIPEVVVPTLAPVVIPREEKVALRTIWKVRVVDTAKIPRQWFILDTKSLGDFARATKGRVKVEGVEFYSETVEVVGGR